MVISFLIATLIIFTINLMLSIFTIGVNAAKESGVVIPAINTLAALIMITWNIIVIVSL